MDEWHTAQWWWLRNRLKYKTDKCNKDVYLCMSKYMSAECLYVDCLIFKMLAMKNKYCHNMTKKKIYSKSMSTWFKVKWLNRTLQISWIQQNNPPICFAWMAWLGVLVVQFQMLAVKPSRETIHRSVCVCWASKVYAMLFTKHSGEFFILSTCQ